MRPGMAQVTVYANECHSQNSMENPSSGRNNRTSPHTPAQNHRNALLTFCNDFFDGTLITPNGINFPNETVLVIGGTTRREKQLLHGFSARGQAREFLQVSAPCVTSLGRQKIPPLRSVGKGILPKELRCKVIQDGGDMYPMVLGASVGNYFRSGTKRAGSEVSEKHTYTFFFSRIVSKVWYLFEFLFRIFPSSGERKLPFQADTKINYPAL